MEHNKYGTAAEEQSIAEVATHATTTPAECRAETLHERFKVDCMTLMSVTEYLLPAGEGHLLLVN